MLENRGWGGSNVQWGGVGWDEEEGEPAAEAEHVLW